MNEDYVGDDNDRNISHIQNIFYVLQCALFNLYKTL